MSIHACMHLYIQTHIYSPSLPLSLPLSHAQTQSNTRNTALQLLARSSDGSLFLGERQSKFDLECLEESEETATVRPSSIPLLDEDEVILCLSHPCVCVRAVMRVALYVSWGWGHSLSLSSCLSLSFAPCSHLSIICTCQFKCDSVFIYTSTITLDSTSSQKEIPH
jgi:hypothetical protein